MRSATALAVLVLVGPLLVGPLPRGASGDEATDPPATTPPEVAALVEQLGARDFEDRERAAADLVELGSAALPLVEAAIANGDLETRVRARRVREAILEDEHEQRIVEFLGAGQPLPDDALPGWGRFRDDVGSDDAARRLFADMQRAERTLFVAVEQHPTEPRRAAALFATRCLELQHRYAHGGTRRLPLASQAAIVFLAGNPDLELSATTQGQVNSFCLYNDLASVLKDASRANLARGVLGCWIARPDDANEATLYTRVQLALRSDVPRGLVPALALLDRKITDYRCEYALFALGRFGGEGHLPLVESLFDNTTALRQSKTKDGKLYRSEVRDAALAVAIHLSGQRVEDYPFPQISRNDQYLFTARSTGFVEDSDRAAAFEQYAASRRTPAEE